MAVRKISALEFALDNVNRASSLPEARRRLERAIAEDSRRPPEGGVGPARLRGRGFFDTLMEAILDRVKQAVSREELVTYTLAALAEDPQTCAGLCYLCLDGDITRNGEIASLSVFASALVQEQRLRNFTAHRLPGLRASPLIRDVMVDRVTLEFLLTDLLADNDYGYDFEALASIRSGPLWLCALPLPPAEAGQHARMILALYPASGAEHAPALPRGASQEWRALVFLRMAYEMLNHQLASTRDLVLSRRRELLKDLAPGIVNHEITQQINGFAQAVNLMQNAAVRIDRHVPEDDTAFESLLKALETMRRAATRLREITNAFNNLERRSTAPFSIDQLLAEIFTLQSYAFAAHGVRTEVDNRAPDDITADAALFEHVLLNVVTNAVEAMTTGPAPPPFPLLRIRITWEDDLLVILVMNNGPPITVARPERIFEKGFTTKPRDIGHGIGLHMCRLIITYLGGAIGLVGPEQLDKDMHVGFRLRLPQGKSVASDMVDLP